VIRRVVFALAALAFPLQAQTPQSIATAVGSITPDQIIRRIGVIADDSMRGRQTPSPELEKVAAFISGEFKRFGLKPGGDSGRFIQRYQIRRTELDTTNSVIAITGGPTLRIPKDAAPGPGPRDIEASGKVTVLTGASIDAASAGALGLGGSVVLVLLGPDDPLGRNSPLIRNLGLINAQRPAAVLLVTSLPDIQWRIFARNALNPRVSPAWHADAAGPGNRYGVPVLLVRDSALLPVLTRAGADLPALARAAAGPLSATPVAASLSVTLRQRTVAGASAPNVVGIVEGSDPALKGEYVVFSGHMDHIGVGAPDARGDSINNGADDDASGTIAVVQMAQAFSKLRPRPRRSLIFLTVSGEERGLWGSEYFTAHPPVPIGQIVADLNTDMVGRNWKDTVVAIGKEHSDLGATLNRVNAAHPELGMTAIDDLWPEEQFYSRSDHFNFAQKGVPILFFFNGVHDDYHRPSDSVDKIDAEKESRIVKLVFYLGLDIADAAEKPKWNPESYKAIVRP